MRPVLKQKKGGPVSWGDAKLVKKRKKKRNKAYYKNKNKRKTLTEIERLRKGVGCARGSQLRVIEETEGQGLPTKPKPTLRWRRWLQANSKESSD